jgi:molybdopterin-guanine dinucleotide biosynthesis protein A
LLRGLLAEARDGVDAVVGRASEALEPLPGLYRRTCLPAVEEALRQGERSLAGLLRRLRIAVVDSDQIRVWDPDLLSYANINTRDDLAWARTHAAVLSATSQPVASGR